MHAIYRLIWFLFLTIFIFLVVIFVSMNKTVVEMKIWPIRELIYFELWLIVFISFALGLLLGTFLNWFFLINLKTKIWNKERIIKNLNKKLALSDEKIIDE